MSFGLLAAAGAISGAGQGAAQGLQTWQLENLIQERDEMEGRRQQIMQEYRLEAAQARQSEQIAAEHAEGEATRGTQTVLATQRGELEKQIAAERNKHAREMEEFRQSSETKRQQLGFENAQKLAQLHTDLVIGEGAKDRGSRERIANEATKVHYAQLEAEQNKAVPQISADGTLMLVRPNAQGQQTAQAVSDPRTGQPLIVGRDLSASDKAALEVNMKMMSAIEAELRQSTLLPEERDFLRAHLKAVRNETYRILGKEVPRALTSPEGAAPPHGSPTDRMLSAPPYRAPAARIPATPAETSEKAAFQQPPGFPVPLRKSPETGAQSANEATDAPQPPSSEANRMLSAPPYTAPAARIPAQPGETSVPAATPPASGTVPTPTGLLQQSYAAPPRSLQRLASLPATDPQRLLKQMLSEEDQRNMRDSVDLYVKGRMSEADLRDDLTQTYAKYVQKDRPDFLHEAVEQTIAGTKPFVIPGAKASVASLMPKTPKPPASKQTALDWYDHLSPDQQRRVARLVDEVRTGKRTKEEFTTGIIAVVGNGTQGIAIAEGILRHLGKG
jgi:hypothetical protein